MFDLAGISLSTIALLLWMETILSADNAIVLADTAIYTLWEDDPERIKKVLRWWYVRAIALRIVVLLFATFIITIWRLKFLAWLYLIRITFTHFFSTSKNNHDHSLWWAFLRIQKKRWINKAVIAKLMAIDLMFAIDNLGTCVSLTHNFWNMAIAVLLAGFSFMLVAKYTVKLVETYPFMQIVAYSMIGLIGLKMIWSSLVGITSISFLESYSQVCSSYLSEQIIIWCSILWFGIPLLTSRLWWYPVRKTIPVSQDPTIEHQ